MLGRGDYLYKKFLVERVWNVCTIHFICGKSSGLAQWSLLQYGMVRRIVTGSSFLLYEWAESDDVRSVDYLPWNNNTTINSTTTVSAIGRYIDTCT